MRGQHEKKESKSRRTGSFQERARTLKRCAKNRSKGSDGERLELSTFQGQIAVKTQNSKPNRAADRRSDRFQKKKNWNDKNGKEESKKSEKER